MKCYADGRAARLLNLVVRPQVSCPTAAEGPAMLDRLFPQRIDNTYRGHRLALWILAVLVLMKGGIGLGTILNGNAAATSADGIPLDTFGPAGGQAFLSIFAAWGLAQLMLNLVGLVALIRYRAMVPFIFVVLLVEHLGRKLIFLALPIARIGTPPGVLINLALIAAMLVGLVLSLRSPDNPPTDGEVT